MLHFLASPAARPISEDEYLLQAPHVCEMDNIRIPVANLVDTCLVYVFPSKAFGFDVVFPNKVLSEHKILATDLDDLESLGPEKWTSEACRVATNTAVLARIETVTKAVQRLQHRKHGSAVPFERVSVTEVIGGEMGLEGFKQAVLYVYKILEPPGLDQSKFESLLYPAEKMGQSLLSSRVSAVTGITAISMDDYVGQLWDHCWKSDPSTFGALYLRTAAWYIDLGTLITFILRLCNRLGIA
ncbi:hypothetical protein BGZ57DRAFT_853444 [Hyaloscypha finlandica]|nr:hypothetical protein BGZ57DRAFT_853444 [Hyaloscypha finlandica]